MPENDIDHKDRIKHHNWILNLREASKQCNLQNCNVQINNKTGITGVCYHKKRKTYIVYIRKNNKTIQIGYYKDFDEAVCTRLAAEQCLEWDKCNLNSSAYKYVKNILSF